MKADCDAGRKYSSGVRNASHDDLKDKLGESFGRRRAPENAVALPMIWPLAVREKHEIMRAWYAAAMIMHGGEARSVRFLAVMHLTFYWPDGDSTATDHSLAQLAACDPKTISRAVASLRKSGLLLVEHFTERDQNGHIVKRRRIRPAFPETLPEGLALPDSVEFERDTRGPVRNGHHRDTRGPDRRDTRGPLYCNLNKAHSEETIEDAAFTEPFRGDDETPVVPVPVSDPSRKLAGPEGAPLGCGDESPRNARAAALAKQTGTYGGDTR